MTLVPIICPNCGGEGQKELGAVNAARKAGKKVYCSRPCSIEGRRKRTPETRAEYMRQYREKNRERLRQYAREHWHGKRTLSREEVLRRHRASYFRNRDRNLVRMKQWREANPDKVRENIDRWYEQNPDKKDFHAAKAQLSTELGIRYRDVPDDLAEAKVEVWRIKRWIREQSSTVEDAGQ